MPRVLISDKLSPAAADIFRDRGVDVDVDTDLSPEQLIAKIGGYDGLAVRSATKVTPAVLEAATNLKVIGRAGIGVDNIDVSGASARGVVVMNTPYGNSITTAEHAIAMLMALARQIPQADASTRTGKWEKSRFMGVELHGKTLGIIGAGNIGSIVADRAQGLKLRTIAYDPYLTEDRARDIGVEKVTLDDLFRRSDIITLHTPLTDATRNIINADAIEIMKQGVRIVNCARGGLVDEQALLAALQSGKVAGAALDVFSVEPAKENPLFDLDTVISTPHLGASTREAQENVALQVAEQMSDFLLDGAVTNALNMPSVTAEEAPRLKPFIDLAQQLGSLLGQVTETSVKAIEIMFEGEVSLLNTRPIHSAILAGLLGPLFENVNMVSAPQVAEDREIKVTEGKREKCSSYQSRIELRVTTERRTRVVAGTVFSNRPRLVQIEDVGLEAAFATDMLYVRNEDKPGLIGRLGMILGNAEVNVANFHLGRSDKGDGAIALVATDEPVPDDVMTTIRSLPDVRTAIALQF